MAECTKPLAWFCIPDAMAAQSFAQRPVYILVTAVQLLSSLPESPASRLPFEFQGRTDPKMYRVVLHKDLFHLPQMLLPILYQHHIKQYRYNAGAQHRFLNKLSVPRFQFSGCRTYTSPPYLFSS